MERKELELVVVSREEFERLKRRVEELKKLIEAERGVFVIGGKIVTIPPTLKEIPLSYTVTVTPQPKEYDIGECDAVLIRVMDDDWFVSFTAPVAGKRSMIPLAVGEYVFRWKPGGKVWIATRNIETEAYIIRFKEVSI